MVIKFNMDKTKVMLLTSKQKWSFFQNDYLSLKIKDVDLQKLSNEIFGEYVLKKTYFGMLILNTKIASCTVDRPGTV